MSCAVGRVFANWRAWRTMSFSIITSGSAATKT